MKKLALLAVLVLTVVSCTKKETPPCPPCPPNPSPAAGAAASTICDELGQDPTSEQIDHWIGTHRTELCAENVDECILSFHNIDATKYDAFIRDYWGSKSPLSSTFTWLDIKGKIDGKCYPEYIGFDIDHEKVTALKVVPQFDTIQTCYSMPLFRAIGKLFGGLDPKDEFKFTLATVDKKTRVIFSVVHKISGATYFFDISDNPTLAPDNPKAKI